MNNKTLTIVIPSYNHKNYIRTSILNAMQLIDIADIVVIDDASDDGTLDILTKESYPGVNIIIKKNNKGLLHSHRLWQQFVQTEYVYLIASDDEIIVDEFRKAYNKLLALKDIDVAIFGGVNFLKEYEWPIYGKKHERFFMLSEKEKKIEIFTNHPSPLLAQSTIFRTSVLSEIDAFDGKVKFDDYPIYIKLILNNSKYKLLFDNNVSIVRYRHHFDNTYKKYNKMFDMFEEVYLYYCQDIKVQTESIALIWWLYIFRSLRDKNWNAFFNILSKGKLSYMKY
ncbi:glycosyltransferase family 2 protein, partial [Escherichia albertii]